jgi:hypothetical protein
MNSINGTVILTKEDLRLPDNKVESVFDFYVDQRTINKATNIIFLEPETGNIRFFKIKDLEGFKKTNQRILHFKSTV